MEQHQQLMTELEVPVILLALALLSLERPGWNAMLREIATKWGPAALPMYEEFRIIHSGKLEEEKH